MKKLTKVKKFIAENGYELVYGTIVVGTIALYGYIIVASAKQQTLINEENAKNQQIMRDAVLAGKTVLPNTDGSYWIIDNDKK